MNEALTKCFTLRFTLALERSCTKVVDRNSTCADRIRKFLPALRGVFDCAHFHASKASIKLIAVGTVKDSSSTGAAVVFASNASNQSSHFFVSPVYWLYA